MTRVEAIRHLVAPTMTEVDVASLKILGVTEDEILQVRHEIWMEHEMRRLERLSPFWRGEEMGT